MELQYFINTVVENKAKVYLVGGAVRDFMLRITPKDHDYCITGMSQESFESIFPDAELQGKDFPVYRMTVNGEYSEVALARTERKVSVGHKGFAIHTSPDVTIDEDLARRDITINAMAIDLETNELVDPYYGEVDLKSGSLRATTEAFTEDPLRVYRIARFAAQFGHDFYIEYGTLMMMGSLRNELHYLPIERVLEEMKKGLMTNSPSLFFTWLKEAGLLDVHFPEINRLSDFDQNKKYHPEGNVFNHTMQVLEAARYFSKLMPKTEETDKQRYDRELTVMLSALLHDIGKAVTAKPHIIHGTPTFHGHEAAGVPIAKQFLTRFNLLSKMEAVCIGVEKHMVMHDAFSATKAAKAVDFVEGKFEMGQDGYIRNKGIRTMGIPEYIALCMADTCGRLADPTKLSKVNHYMIMTVNAFNERDASLLSSVLKGLKQHFDDAYAFKLFDSLMVVAKHKTILEKFEQFSPNVLCWLDMNELKEKYQGPDLGFRIHSDKRRQRTKLMQEARSDVRDFIMEWKGHLLNASC